MKTIMQKKIERNQTLYAITEQGKAYFKQNRFLDRRHIEFTDTYDGISKWQIFCNEICHWAENVPPYEGVQDIINGSKPVWDFKKSHPDFQFATYDDLVTDLIMSVNPIVTSSYKYIGTVDQVVDCYGTVPRTGLLICNSPSKEQMLQMEECITEYDEEAGLKNTWEIIYV